MRNDDSFGHIHDGMANKLFVVSTTRNKVPPRGRLRESEVSFPFADHAIVAHHVIPQAFNLVLSTTVDVFDCAIVVFSKTV